MTTATAQAAPDIAFNKRPAEKLGRPNCKISSGGKVIPNWWTFYSDRSDSM